MALCDFTRSGSNETVYVNPKLVVAVHRGDQSVTSIVMQVADQNGGPLVVMVRDEINDVVKRLDQAARS
jgi:predicted transcriptional regulator